MSRYWTSRSGAFFALFLSTFWGMNRTVIGGMLGTPASSCRVWVEEQARAFREDKAEQMRNKQKEMQALPTFKPDRDS